MTNHPQSAIPSPLLPSTTWSGRQHLLDSQDLTLTEIDYLLHLAKQYKSDLAKTVPLSSVLSGRILANLFFENSTRTRISFELAAKHLGMTVINFDVGTSSVQKGESLEDTGRTLEAMGTNIIVQRHAIEGSASKLVEALGDKIHVINAGEGITAHPTQALLDSFTMLECIENLEGAKIAIIGDIAHSRVARSNFWLLQKLGASVHFFGPPAFLPHDLSRHGAKIETSMEGAIDNADFVMVLRIQLERQGKDIMPSREDYIRNYRLDHKRLSSAKRHVKIMHPGPVNRDVEITDTLASDLTFSLINRQVANGIPVRMSILAALSMDR